MVTQQPQLTIGKQIAGMQKYFPKFTFRPEKRIPIWQGILQPSDNSPAYMIKVRYCMPKAPQVWVLRPKLRLNAPHRYGDGSLCLYYPPDESWTSSKLIAETIVPWTAIWLVFYEIWLRTGKWYGPEAPHNLP